MAQHSTEQGRVALDVFVSEKWQRFFSCKTNHAPTWPTWFCDVTVAAARLLPWKFLCRELQVNRGITLASWRWYNPSSHVSLWECFGNCWMWFVTVERLGKSGRNKEHLKKHQCFWIGRKDISEAGKPGNSNTTNQVVGFDPIFLFKFVIPTKRRGGKFHVFFFCQVGALLGHEGPQSLTALLRGRGAMGEASFTWAKANLIYHNLYQELV